MDILMILKACVLLIYGMMKMTLCIIELNPNIKFPFITHDNTMAGLLLVMIYIAFSLYTILYGLSIFGILPEFLLHIFNHKYKSFIFYSILGVVLIILYGCILYTKLPIEKNTKHTLSYEILGVGAGMLFIVSAIFSLVRMLIFERGSSTNIILLIIVMLMMVAIFIMYASYCVKKNMNKNESIMTYLITSSIIPFIAI